MRPCGRTATSGVGGRNIFWRRPKGDFLTDGASESRKWRNPSLGDSTRSCREPGADGNSVESGAVGAVHSPSLDGRPIWAPFGPRRPRSKGRSEERPSHDGLSRAATRAVASAELAEFPGAFDDLMEGWRCTSLRGAMLSAPGQFDVWSLSKTSVIPAQAGIQASLPPRAHPH